MREDGLVTYRFTAPLWRYKGESAWHFITLPFEESDEIEERTSTVQRGFGSVRVHVTIGHTSWSTSVFPDTKAESYILPVKKPVRVAEGLVEGAMVEVSLDIVAMDIAATETAPRPMTSDLRP
jgi:hypothetical protein